MGKRPGLIGIAALVVLGAETQPTAGQGRLSLDPDDGALDMSAFLATSHGFLPVATLITEPALVLGLRIEGGAAGEAAPFWARPSVGLRGVARNRYSGDRSGVFEGEVRWDLTRRWSAVGFGGAGWTTRLDDTERENRWLGGGGAGVRYLLARAFGIRGGADLAYGSDGWAFYITMGSAWGGI